MPGNCKMDADFSSPVASNAMLFPRPQAYSREQWPHLVSRMSGRANLSACEQTAIVAYLRAASLHRH